MAVAAGGQHTCALTTEGGVKCWGENSYGQLGDGRACGEVCATPVNVVGLTSDVVAIAPGGDFTCALTTAGSVKCWGSNIVGELGATTAETCPIVSDYSPPCSTTPLDVSALSSGVEALDAGFSHACALTTSTGAVLHGKSYSVQVWGLPIPLQSGSSGRLGAARERWHRYRGLPQLRPNGGRYRQVLGRQLPGSTGRRAGVRPELRCARRRVVQR